MNREIARRLLLRSVLVGWAAVLSCGPSGASDELPKGKEEEAQAEQGRKDMQRSAAQYILWSADMPRLAFKFHETPYLRSSNPVGDSKDGALFLWTYQGRPQAVLKLYTFNHKTFTHAWLSLSEGTFVGERDGQIFWSPMQPGIKFHEVPDAPQPAGTAAERLRQMKTLSAKFTATYVALSSDGKPFELRLLTQPLLRYETEDDHRADGTVFCYVQSTAPVGLLLLESRPTPDGQRWHYAYSSLTSGLVTARYTETELFSLERGNSHRDSKQPYLLFHSQPVPKE